MNRLAEADTTRLALALAGSRATRNVNTADSPVGARGAEDVVCDSLSAEASQGTRLNVRTWGSIGAHAASNL